MKTAIITLDIINDICHPRGKLARYSDRISSKNIIENINKINSWGRQKGYFIIHIKVGFHHHYLDGSTKSPIFSNAKNKHALDLNQWGGQFCDSLQIKEDDIIIIKHRVSAFYGTDLDLILHANHIEKLILTGVATNNALELSAREAHDRDYEVTIVEDATECANDEEKKTSLKFLLRIAKIISMKDLYS